MEELLNSLKKRYNGSKFENIGELVFAPCLAKCELYRRRTGWLKSSSLYAWTPALTSIVQRDNVKIELITYPGQLDVDLINALDKNLKKSEFKKHLSNHGDLALLAALGLQKDPNRRDYKQKVLSYLLESGKLEIKFACMKVLPHEDDLYHYKDGYFVFPDSNRVALEGSANDSQAGLSSQGNNLRVYKSSQEKDLEDIDEIAKLVDRDWNEENDEIIVEKPSKEVLKRIREYAPSKREIIKKPRKDNKSEIKLLNKEHPTFEFSTEIGEGDSKQIIDTHLDPREHQEEALNNWVKNGCFGVLEHATASGKTFTGIMAIKYCLQQNMSCLVIVPREILMYQWEREIKEEIHDFDLLLVHGGNSKWKKQSILTDHTAPLKAKPRIVIAIKDSARSGGFISKCYDGDHLFVLADEVHTLGSRENRKIFDLAKGAALGLSATPERMYDREGTESIFNYFHGKIEPTYSLFDALNDGHLCKYEYFPNELHLTPSEADKWATKTEEIARIFARAGENAAGEKIVTQHLKLKLVERARIAKKAVKKIPLAQEIVVSNFKKGQRWLVFCDNQIQLNELATNLNNQDLPAFVYHSEMEGDKEKTLKVFEKSGGIMVSIKMLDEGVDIPNADHALIVASSTNSREYIQRRGRVLRKPKDGSFKRAVIYDLLVTPISLELEPEQTKLLETELKRALEFSGWSNNKSIGQAIIRGIARKAGINLDDIPTITVEVEDE